ncbi:unnamed protein product [Dovyalis caffra]|uniref:B3 domain-containing protein n=1 Tax=Dovyalis caffra TaxID=77055 RepID=A0AAV1RY47_9ROSI|nr:unnamed protein product [Dovyalis caffra]
MSNSRAGEESFMKRTEVGLQEFLKARVRKSEFRVRNKREPLLRHRLKLNDNYLATKNGVNDPKLVIIKQLYDTDLNPQHCRFSIPVNQVIDRDFLSPEDRRRLDNREAIDVTLIQPCLEEKPMHLKKWIMNRTGIYVLNKGWNSVIRNRKNSLRLNSTVEIWSFTWNGALYFALSTRDDDTHTAICAGSGRNGKSGDLNEDMEPTSDDDESGTITFQEDV